MPVKKCDDLEFQEIEITTSTSQGTETTDPTITPIQYLGNASVGKNILAVESNIYDNDDDRNLDPVFVFGNGYVTTGRPAPIADPLRAEARKFFALGENEEVVYVNSSVEQAKANNKTKNNYPPPPIGFNFGTLREWSSPHTSPAVLNFYTQDVEVVSNYFSYTNQFGLFDKLALSEWLAFCGGAIFSHTQSPEQPVTLSDNTVFGRPGPLVDTATIFTDHHTTLVAPMTPEELEYFANIINNPAYAKVEANYNFFVPGYETYIASSDIKEYYLENQFSNITRENSTLQQKLHALGSDLEYIKKYLTTPGLGFVDKFKNTGIPQESVHYLKTVTDTDDLYPMICTVEMKTETTGKFGVASEQAGMTNELLKHVMDQTIIYPGNEDFASANNALSFLISSEVVAYTQEFPDRPILQPQQQIMEIPLIPIDPWLKAYLGADPEEVDGQFDTVALLFGISPAAAAESEACSQFSNTLKSLILSGKLHNIVNENFRTYQEMIEGKEAYNESIIYEIVKHADTGTTTVFIPNTQELDLLTYVDSQIKYDENYKYEIYVHQLIVGTKYNYYNFDYKKLYGQGDKQVRADFSVQYQPSLQIARIPIFSQTAIVLDDAPVFPNVEIIPFKGVNNRVLINLDGNSGTYDLKPIIISEQDSEFVKKYREERQLSSSDPITFTSDDPVSQFEIYRLSEAPKSYADFNNQILATVSTPGASSTSFIDEIAPNTKYYYTFRSIDIHENRSNPTDIYVIELVQFEGMVFFIQSIYDFENDTYHNVKTTENFRRYLKINPNLIQSMINYNQLGELSSAFEASNMVLGHADESVWGKKFKVRVTSKNSGKKFDINLTCKVNFKKQKASEPYTQAEPIDPQKANKK